MRLAEYEEIVEVLGMTILRAIKTYEHLSQNHSIEVASAKAMEEAEEFFCAKVDRLVEANHE